MNAEQKTPEQLASEEEQLTEKLNRTKNERQVAENKRLQEQQQAANKLRQDKEDQISGFELKVIQYRSEALVSRRDSEKKKLYVFAYESEVSANELRKELGLPLLEYSLDDQLSHIDKEAKRNTFLKISGLLVKAAIALFVYIVTDYVGDKMNGGFFSYLFGVFSKISYFVSSVYGGCWLVCIILFSFTSNYVIGNLKADFESLKPFHKMLLLTALGATILHLLNGSNLYGE